MEICLRISCRGLLIILVLGACILYAPAVVAETNQAGLKLQVASDAVNGAFNAVLGAEKAGANVTALLNRLDSALFLLAQAEIAYRNGDSHSAAAKADTVVSQSSEIKSSAEAQESAEVVSGKDAFMWTVGFSSVGCIVFVLGLFFAWRKLKSSYVRNLGGEQPQVIGDEA